MTKNQVDKYKCNKHFFNFDHHQLRPQYRFTNTTASREEFDTRPAASCLQINHRRVLGDALEIVERSHNCNVALYFAIILRPIGQTNWQVADADVKRTRCRVESNRSAMTAEFFDSNSRKFEQKQHE